MFFPFRLTFVAPPFVAACILLGPSPARAADAASAQPAPPSTTSLAAPAEHAPKPTRWYGYEILAVDGVGVAVLIPALATTDGGMQTGFSIATGLTYGLGGPIVHFTHGQVLKGVLDIGMRLSLPIATGFLGGVIGASSYQPQSCTGGPAFCPLSNALDQIGAEAEGILIGGLIGMGSAIAIDAAALAREPDGGSSRAPDAEPAPVRDTFTSRIEPALGLVPERQGGARATVGLIGTF
jgi:hypothetical protein